MPDPKPIWHAALGQLQLVVNGANYETFLKDTRGVAFDGRQFTLSAPNPFIREALQTRFQGLIRRALGDVLGHPPEVAVVVGSSVHPDPLTALAEPTLTLDRGQKQQSYSTGARYTFDTFVVGEANRLAHAAARAVSDRPGQEYNPLFLYGGVGLGKTHLLRAMEDTLSRRGVLVLYVSSEKFTNDLIESIRDNRTEDFRQKYRQIQVLLIDDIQFLATRERTQEEFFHTFNDVHAAGGQIVLTSDRPPKAISPLEARLRSRFEWGLIADVQAPDLETRIAILHSKLNGRAQDVPPEVLEMLARKAPHNIRELEGALNRVLMQAQLHGQPLSSALAAEAIDGLLPDQQRPLITADTILQAVCAHFHVPLTALQSKARDRKHVVPRHYAMYLLREEARLSLPEIGAILGGRDHTTVRHGWEKVRNDLDATPATSMDL
ncbi:MAG: chromosomal replication initiator protein DnaA, partial [Chloroflexota bacterium]